ncbi:hypothetical protein WMF20_39090 [Sorangium sp. So ce834]|uniref:hypothetical protein n=1 Tax=Sorangium sp. So ce834 TaxID=3133321 RepID=UPI003F6118B0
MSTSDQRLSIAVWAALPEDEPGELVDGCLVEEQVSSAAHEAAVVWLIATASSSNDNDMSHKLRVLAAAIEAS